MVTQITKGIKISVDTFFQGTCYKESRLHYAFEYSISIENQSSEVVQLNTRHWVILDSLNNEEVVAIDGSMQDVLLTNVVEKFAQEKEELRILIATEVASEGINLHYLCHRLVHFDIPWSLMTLQQRNGRIDRYGQQKQPKVRYLLTQSCSEGMGDADKILRLLINKDQQAQQNIGDPSVFLRVFDLSLIHI